jgi:FkbM family methyltransferase
MRYWNLIRNLSNWWLHFAVKFRLTEADPLIFRTRNGITIEAPRRLLHEFKEIFLENAYVSGFEASLPRNPTIIDIGANAGFFTLFAASVFPKASIYSFEPVPENFQQLLRNRARNSQADISCFPVAVCGHDGEIFLNFELEDNFTTAATILSSAEAGGKGLTVSCVSLATIFQNNSLDTCDLLKLDCEGAEFDILYSCPSEAIAKVQRVAMEVHAGNEEGHTMEALVAWLGKHGFVVRYRKQMLWAWRSGQL